MNTCRTMGLLLALGAAASAVAADRVVLKGGHEVVGEILKSDDDVVIVDIGAAVLRLPRNQVLRVTKDQDAATQPGTEPAVVEEKKGPQWQLYRTARLTPTTIEKNTERFAEAVVMVTTPRGMGSGFVITPDGHLVTNYHVIARETRIKVTVFRRGERGYEQKHYKKVKIIAINPFVDMALLKIEGEEKPFRFAYLGDMKEVEAGQRCFAIGNPLGLTRTVSQGIVSTKNRNYQGHLYIQTTTDVNPGNSGGPLFNYKGEVIGVTSMGYLFLSGLNFAVPVDVVKRFIQNRDAFAYDEDNPNSGYRYLQPNGRGNKEKPPPGKLPSLDEQEPTEGAGKGTTPPGAKTSESSGNKTPRGESKGSVRIQE